MAKRKELKPKICRECPTEFIPRTSMQIVCSPLCALKYERKRQAKAFKRSGRERLRTRSDWIKLAQAEFNRFIKLRDAELPCISCGVDKPTGGLRKDGFDAGHYRSTAAAPELRFSELNVHKQCNQCNTFKSGNIVEYRIRLIDRIGEEKVAWLEGPHEPKKYTIEALKGIREKYKALCKELISKEE